MNYKNKPTIISFKGASAFIDRIISVVVDDYPCIKLTGIGFVIFLEEEDRNYVRDLEKNKKEDFCHRLSIEIMKHIKDCLKNNKDTTCTRILDIADSFLISYKKKNKKKLRKPCLITDYGDKVYLEDILKGKDKIEFHYYGMAIPEDNVKSERIRFSFINSDETKICNMKPKEQNKLADFIKAKAVYLLETYKNNNWDLTDKELRDELEIDLALFFEKEALDGE